MNTIDNFSFKGQKALVRVDFNVPLDDAQKVKDDTRIRAALPTIKKILDEGGAVILMSHLGRPKDGPEDKFSLKHIVYKLEELLNTNVEFANDCIGEEAERKASNLGEGKMLLLENLRFYKEETKGDEGFAQKLAKLGNIYVNDAFGAAHRRHASTAVIADSFPEKKCFGYLMAEEVSNLKKVMLNPEKPFTAIVGGAKVSDKVGVLESLINKADNVIIGGAMAYTFKKAAGGNVGKSLVEEEKLELANELVKLAEEKGVKLLLPADSVIADDFNNNANIKTSASNDIPNGWMGLDIADEAISEYTKVIEESKVVLWNGPMGVFEMENFSKGTKSIAQALVRATQKGAYTLVGGGDSVAAINKFGMADKVSYISTGGGAMMEFIEGKDLPGVSAIEN